MKLISFNCVSLNILCLQDTHLIKSDEHDILTTFPTCKCIIHGCKTNSRGVAIIIKNNFEYSIKNITTDSVGNLLLVDLQLPGFSLRIINIYAPNNDNPQFFDKLSKYIEDSNETYSIICGDFNLTLDPNIDSNNYVNINNPWARSKVLDIVKNLKLSDAFRLIHPTTKRYTWRRRNPVKQARLDYFLISETFTDLVQNCQIKPGYRSDHSRVDMDIILDTFKQGRGIWKFNCSLLRNPDYLKLINDSIMTIKKEYAVPVYDLEYLDSIQDLNINFTITDDIFLETLLLKIRGDTIKFASKLKKEHQTKELHLVAEIEQLEKVETICATESLRLKQEELKQLRECHTRGQMIRSRVQNLFLFEKPTREFCNLEKHNYTEKTIKKITLNDGKVITNQKVILDQIRTFYARLFENKKNCHNDFDWNSINNQQNKLTPEEALNIEGPLTVTEIGDALKGMKHNKTPGIDGFPAEFYKMFWSKLKYFVLRAFNYSYSKGTLPLSLRQTIISCLPKGNKQRDLLKNWRPISLLSVLYKIASSSIASRLKPLLAKLIDNTQTGFIKGRYIGEGTRIIYDLMNYTERKNIDGLLMLIDFEKAFDSISWKFLYQVLKNFGFGPDFIRWIELFNSNIKATVLQAGFLSEFINIERGCKQGDPIAPYLFIICAQILCTLINKNKAIKGVQVGSEEYKITQFADDTTIILDGSERFLLSALNTIEIFGTASGLKMNTSKTKLIWIGRKKFSKEKINTNCKLEWGATDFSFLGIEFNVELNKIPEINFPNVLSKIDKLLKGWNKRCLTPIGKITVIKTLAVSKLNHIIMTCPVGQSEYIKQLEYKFYAFLWSNKPDKVKRINVTQSYQNGGLKMINLEYFVRAMKCTWIRRLLQSQNTQWATLFEKICCPISTLIDYGPHGVRTIVSQSRNQFWKEVFEIWDHIYNALSIKTQDNILSLLWCNSKVKRGLLKDQWYKNGITMVGDLVNCNTLKMKSKTEIEDVYNFKIKNFLDYYEVRGAIKKLMGDTEHQRESPERPWIPNHLSFLIKQKKGCKNIYNILNSKSGDNKYRDQWNHELNTIIDNINWKRIFFICFNTLLDNKLIWFQYKLIYQILGTNKLLHQIGKSQENACRICKSATESIVHLFVSCKVVMQLWKDLNHWLDLVLNKHLVLAPLEILLGHLNNDNNFLPVNSLILVTKYYIFICAVNAKIPNFKELCTKLKICYDEQLLLSTNISKEEEFKKNWLGFKKLFEPVSL